MRKIQFRRGIAKVMIGIMTVTGFSGAAGTEGIPVVSAAQIKKDTKKPKLKWKGKTKYTVEQGKAIRISKVTAKDGQDGNLTKKIKVTVKKGKKKYKTLAKKIQKNKKVTFSAIGTYTVQYTVKDRAGNKVSKKRYVIVKKKR